jgi:hypothetical protein
MTSPEVGRLGNQLDEHHAPETNGRMAVCRRCGIRTDSPLGLSHVPGAEQVARGTSWLEAELRNDRIAELRD